MVLDKEVDMKTVGIWIGGLVAGGAFLSWVFNENPGAGTAVAITVIAIAILMAIIAGVLRKWWFTVPFTVLAVLVTHSVFSGGMAGDDIVAAIVFIVVLVLGTLWWWQVWSPIPAKAGEGGGKNKGKKN
jgi:hypothetical protein